MNNIIESNDASFDSHIRRSASPVIACFSASWCRSCEAMAPVLDQIAHDPAAGITVVKVDIDAFPELAARYDVRTVPTLAFFQLGIEIGRHVGVADKATVLGALRVAAAALAASA